jgi:hypothetical protein
LGLVACLAVLLLAACGSASRPAPRPLRLTIDAPIDGATTLARQVLVRGRVAPPSGAARVLVAGQPVAVSAGSFSVRVAVRPGSNVIDVLAGGPRTRAAMSAVRVYRQLPVTMPDLAGQSAPAAAAELRRLDLKPQVSDEGGFFQSLLPLSKHVCATLPPAGQALAPGSYVTVEIAKVC